MIQIFKSRGRNNIQSSTIQTDSANCAHSLLWHNYSIPSSFPLSLCRTSHITESTTWNTSAVTSRSGTFWAYGDSLALRFAGQVRFKPLCRRLYAQCSMSYNWMYPIDGRGTAYHKKTDDNLDFDRPRVVNAIRNVLNLTRMNTPNSTLFLNLGLHHAKRVNFTTFQAVLYDIVALLKERDAESSAPHEELRYKRSWCGKRLQQSRKKRVPTFKWSI